MLFTILIVAFAIGAFLFIRDYITGIAEAQENAYKKVKAKENKWFKRLCTVAAFWAFCILIWKKHVVMFGLGVTFIVFVVLFVLLCNTINDLIIGRTERKVLKLYAFGKMVCILEILYLFSWIVIEAR